MIPFDIHRSSGSRVAHCVVNQWLWFVFCCLDVLWYAAVEADLFFHVGILWVALSSLSESSMFAACATAEPFLDFQSIRRFFISSVIIHVPEAQKRDGVTVADVNSCQWLTKVAYAHLMLWLNSTL